MSGVLHPEGPEPVQTYWLRRVLVLLGVVILLLVSLGLARASSGATRTAAPPPVATVPSPSATPTPSSATPSASPTPTPTSSSAGSAGRTASVTPRCERDQLTVSLSAKQRLKILQPAAFAITVRNGGDDACQMNLAKIDFELKMTSGKKLIWSSRACSTATFSVVAKLELDQSVSWVMIWDGRSIAAGCTKAGPPPKAGTYLATAQVVGAKAAQLPITLRG